MRSALGEGRSRRRPRYDAALSRGDRLPVLRLDRSPAAPCVARKAARRSRHGARRRQIEGLAIVPRAGTPIARDGDTVWSAPYDDTVLVMPSMRHLKPGNTQVRLGR